MYSYIHKCMVRHNFFKKSTDFNNSYFIVGKDLCLWWAHYVFLFNLIMGSLSMYIFTLLSNNIRSTPHEILI